jgi:hypothetical protein
MPKAWRKPPTLTSLTTMSSIRRSLGRAAAMTSADLMYCRSVGMCGFRRIHRRNTARIHRGFAANTGLTADSFKYRRLTGDTRASFAKLVWSADRTGSFWPNFPRIPRLTQIALAMHDLPQVTTRP